MILSTWCKFKLSSWLRTRIADADDALADADSHADCRHWCCFCENLLLGCLCRLHRANEVHHNWELTQHQGICILVTNMLITQWCGIEITTTLTSAMLSKTSLFSSGGGSVVSFAFVKSKCKQVELGDQLPFPSGEAQGEASWSEGRRWCRRAQCLQWRCEMISIWNVYQTPTLIWYEMINTGNVLKWNDK